MSALKKYIIIATTKHPHPNPSQYGLELTEKDQAHFLTFLIPSLYGPTLTEKTQGHFLTFVKPLLYLLLLQLALSWRRLLSISLFKIDVRCKIWRKAIAFLHNSIVSDRKAAIFLSFQSFWLVVSISVVHTAALKIAFPYFHGSISSHSCSALITKVVSLSLSWRSVSSPEWALCSSSVA